MSQRALKKPLPVNDSFPLRLRNARLQKNLAQFELARLIDVGLTHYGRYERGETVPPADVLTRIAEVLDCSIDYLLLGKPSSSSGTIEDAEMHRMFLEAATLPNEEKALVTRFLNAFLLQWRVQEMAVRQVSPRSKK